ncbi:hypothetical protein HYW75_06915 [Candidatus Pacearchaeota archaeon]|nr:hypothetical protein [Candidatus Pacearchaeota archaeon]
MVIKERNTCLEPRTASAIKLSIEIGRRIQQDLPRIAEDYGKLLSRKEIANKYNICEMYGVDIEIAKPAISYAIRGYHGEENVGKHRIPRFEGLITDKKELKRIRLKLIEKGLEYMVIEKIGIHSQNIEERRLLSSKGGVNSAISNGFVPWSNEELDEAYRCSENNKYWCRKGYAGKHRVDNNLIADRINKLFHKGERVRNGYKVKIKLCRYRKKIER